MYSIVVVLLILYSECLGVLTLSLFLFIACCRLLVAWKACSWVARRDGVIFPPPHCLVTLCVYLGISPDCSSSFFRIFFFLACQRRQVP